jgi:hypothetical protein
VRGFAVKFYTKEGNWDLVGNNIPVFFIQDAMKFPDLVHAVKEEPDRAFPQAQTAHDNFWDFISLSPESMHMVMWIMSDRTIPRSYRFMEGFGVHTFRFVNNDGKSTFVKFHWKPKLGLQSVMWNEAVKINGADPDFHRRDLWENITNGSYPEWELGVQLFDQEFADKELSCLTVMVRESIRSHSQLLPIDTSRKRTEATLSVLTRSAIRGTPAVGFIVGAAVRVTDCHVAVLLEVQEWASSGLVNGDMRKIGGTQTRELCVQIGEVAALE